MDKEVVLKRRIYRIFGISILVVVLLLVWFAFEFNRQLRPSPIYIIINDTSEYISTSIIAASSPSSKLEIEPGKRQFIYRPITGALDLSQSPEKTLDIIGLEILKVSDLVSAGVISLDGKQPVEDVAEMQQSTTLEKVGDDGRYVTYEGSITVSGVYTLYEEDSFFGEQLCFDVNDSTGYLVPRDPHLYGSNNGDNRKPWFCFSNQAEAKQMLEVSAVNETVSGDATIVISQYVVDKLEGGVYDTAQLDVVVE